MPSRLHRQGRPRRLLCCLHRLQRLLPGVRRQRGCFGATDPSAATTFATAATIATASVATPPTVCPALTTATTASVPATALAATAADDLERHREPS